MLGCWVGELEGCRASMCTWLCSPDSSASYAHVVRVRMLPYAPAPQLSARVLVARPALTAALLPCHAPLQEKDAEAKKDAEKRKKEEAAAASS